MFSDVSYSNIQPGDMINFGNHIGIVTSYDPETQKGTFKAMSGSNNEGSLKEPEFSTDPGKGLYYGTTRPIKAIRRVDEEYYDPDLDLHVDGSNPNPVLQPIPNNYDKQCVLQEKLISISNNSPENNYEYVDEVRNSSKEVFDNADDSLTNNEYEDQLVRDALKESLKNLSDELNFRLDQLQNLTRDINDDIIDLMEEFSQSVDALKQSAGEVFDDVLTGVKNQFEETKTAVEDYIESVKINMNDLLSASKEALDEFWDEFNNGVSLFLDNSNLLNKARSLFSTAETTRSPLVLDLDGDGVETTSITNGTYFDHDANGFAEQTGWAGNDDGLLVLDRNANGIIDDGSELFGNNTILENGQKAANGYAALAELDTNLDGKIDASDAAYTQLRVWKNSADGQGGQLITLSDAGVESISTGYTNTNITDANGNQIKQTGTFTRTNGSTGQSADVWFKTDTASTIDQTQVEISETIAPLPNLQGFGNVHSLHTAMALDTTGRLQSLVEQFAAETDPTARKDIMLHIMYAWAGVENVDPYSRAATRYYGNAIGDARKLETLEAFLGEKYYGTWCWGERDPNPHGKAAPILLKAFDELTSSMMQKLMAQTHLKSLFDGIALTWDAANETFALDVSIPIAALQTAYNTDPGNGMLLITQFGQSLAAYSDFGKQVMDTIRQQGDAKTDDFSFLLSTLGMATVTGDAANNSLFASSGSDTALLGLGGEDRLYGGNGNDKVFGGDGDDTLYGGNGNDMLNGGAGDDYISGGAGNDKLDGDAGNDRLLGEAGDDTYIFGRGSGNDTIQDSQGNTRILLNGINPTDITFLQPYSWSEEIVLTITDTAETLRIAGDWNANSRIVFADGTEWDKGITQGSVLHNSRNDNKLT